MRGHRCTGQNWNFWWIEFHLLDSSAVPLDKVYFPPIERGEQENLQGCFEGLISQGPGQDGLVSARWAVILHGWLNWWRKSALAAGPHDRAIQQSVELMRKNLARPLSIETLAQRAHLCPRRFRQVFRQKMGRSPKKFYDSLRLRAAVELLRMGSLSVSQVAVRLGYSSPFHFSRAFKSFYGQSPSKPLLPQPCRVDGDDEAPRLK
jgi:AraC-like DNA-binding protein